MMPKPQGTQAMGFREYLDMLGLGDEVDAEPDVTAEDALAIAERIRAADRRTREATTVTERGDQP